jgi:hypothetical protein
MSYSNSLLAGLLAGVTAATVTPAIAAPAGNAFNPKISLILDGTYIDYSRDDVSHIPGFILGPETELRSAGFALGESELVIESNIDHRFHGWTTIALENEDGDTVVAVEEAYIDTLALPAGLALKFGRFFSEIGYQNHQHSHAWDFVDAPLPYRAMLATRLADDGVQLRWVAPTNFLLELGGELLRGDGFPAGGEDRSGINAFTLFAHLGGDVGDGGSWRVGLSQLETRDNNRLTEDNTAFIGDSRISILDAVYKWAPHGNATERNLSVQAEYMHRSESGVLISEPDDAADSSLYAGRQDGWYLQGVYQFVRGWRVGLRYDRLSSDNTLSNPAPGTPLERIANLANEKPQSTSLMVDWSPSEFSRFRLQYKRDNTRPDDMVDQQVFLQYTFSLGAHPAHSF